MVGRTSGTIGFYQISPADFINSTTDLSLQRLRQRRVYGKRISKSETVYFGTLPVPDFKHYIWDGANIDVFDVSKEDVVASAATDRIAISYSQQLKIALVVKDDAMSEVIKSHVDMSTKLVGYLLTSNSSRQQNWLGRPTATRRVTPEYRRYAAANWWASMILHH